MDKGADVNKADIAGDTPLHVAAKKGNSACVKVSGLFGMEPVDWNKFLCFSLCTGIFCLL